MTSIQQCTICYEELADGLSAAPCGHVFHSVCIGQWLEHGRHCPICHVSLPSQLLKLFYEPQKESAQDTAVSGASAGACAGADDMASPTSESGTGKSESEPVSADVTDLRRQLASSNKYNEARKVVFLKQSRDLHDLKRQLNEARMDARTSTDQLEAEVVLAKGKLETTQIDLFKKHKELNKLKREMEGTIQRLREFQGERVAYGYLIQFSSPGRGGALSGLGQVDVEKVIKQIRQGSTQAETVIRGQHEQLTGAIDREQRTKRELRKSRTDSETVALELQQMQSRLTKAKKDAYRLEKILAKSTAHNKAAEAEAQAGRRRSAPLTASPDAILGDWVAQERPRKDGGERTWALSRKSSSGSSGGKKETSPSTRARPQPVGGHSAAAATAVVASSKGMGHRPAKKRRRAEEEDLVSLGSDDDDDSEDGDWDTRAVKNGFKRTAETWARERPLKTSTLLTPVPSARSFFTTAAAVSGGRGGVQRNGKRAKFISSGHNAVGGRHKVLLPLSSSFSSSLKNPVCLGGKQSRLAASSRH